MGTGYTTGHSTAQHIEELKKKIAGMTPGTPFHNSAVKALAEAEAQLVLDRAPNLSRA